MTVWCSVYTHQCDSFRDPHQILTLWILFVHVTDYHCNLDGCPASPGMDEPLSTWPRKKVPAHLLNPNMPRPVSNYIGKSNSLKTWLLKPCATDMQLECFQPLKACPTKCFQCPDINGHFTTPPGIWFPKSISKLGDSCVAMYDIAARRLHRMSNCGCPLPPLSSSSGKQICTMGIEASPNMKLHTGATCGPQYSASGVLALSQYFTQCLILLDVLWCKYNELKIHNTALTAWVLCYFIPVLYTMFDPILE
jgi:hypothetical protein